MPAKYAHFFEHPWGQAAGFDLHPGESRPDLRRIGCFLWWCTNFDDRVSSILTSWSEAILYQHLSHTGSSFFIDKNLFVTLPWSWATQATSVRGTEAYAQIRQS